MGCVGREIRDPVMDGRKPVDVARLRGRQPGARHRLDRGDHPVRAVLRVQLQRAEKPDHPVRVPVDGSRLAACRRDLEPALPGRDRRPRRHHDHLPGRRRVRSRVVLRRRHPRTGQTVEPRLRRRHVDPRPVPPVVLRRPLDVPRHLMAHKPVLHRRDHEHGGADPVRITWESDDSGGGGGGAAIASGFIITTSPVWSRSIPTGTRTRLHWQIDSGDVPADFNDWWQALDGSYTEVDPDSTDIVYFQMKQRGLVTVSGFVNCPSGGTDYYRVATAEINSGLVFVAEEELGGNYSQLNLGGVGTPFPSWGAGND